MCLVANNKRKPIRADNRISGEIPYYGANNIQDYVEGYTHDGEYILIAEDGSKSLENYSIQYVNGKFWANNHIHIVSGKEYLSNRFLFHWLSQYNFKPFLNGGDRAKLTTANLIKLQIPLPPLSVQQKIAEILDNFCELEKELEKELELRKKQYAYYRDNLLSFNEIGGGNRLIFNNLRWKTLGEIGEFYGGLSGKNKNDFNNGNAKFISYVNVFSNIATNIETCDFVKISEGEKQNSVQYGDVLFTGSSENLEECGMSSVVNKIIEENIYLNSFCFGYRLNDNELFLPDFLKFLFRSTEIRKQIVKTANGVTRFNVSKKKMEKIKIPIPPIEEQKRIVEILDKFDTLTNSISEGLPKEIALRRKQYEYYRERLLMIND